LHSIDERGERTTSEKESLENYRARMAVFLENREKFPSEELQKYAAQWVAWSPDGSRIVTSCPDPDALDDLVRAAGCDPLRCVSSFVFDGEPQVTGLTTQ
jgi:hypothetical protein